MTDEPEVCEPPCQFYLLNIRDFAGSHRPRLYLFNNVRSPDQSLPSNDASKSKSHHWAISLNVTVGWPGPYGPSALTVTVCALEGSVSVTEAAPEAFVIAITFEPLLVPCDKVPALVLKNTLAPLEGLAPPRNSPARDSPKGPLAGSYLVLRNLKCQFRFLNSARRSLRNLRLDKSRMFQSRANLWTSFWLCQHLRTGAKAQPSGRPLACLLRHVAISFNSENAY